MARFTRYCKIAAVLAALSVILLAGCSQKSTAETEAVSTDGNYSEEAAAADASETQSADELISEASDIAADFQKDSIKIELIKPEKPDDLGSVNSLNYKGMSFDAPLPEEVTGEDVDEYLTSYVLPYVPVAIEDGTVEEGDTVNINYEGLLDGEPFDGGTGTYDLVIGSGSFIEGFEEGLIGAKTGDSLSLNLTFPEDYWNEELAGQDVVFNVDINSISRIITIDEYDDAAARSVMGDDTYTAESSREYILDYLTRLSDVSAKSTLYNNAIAAAAEASDIEPSEDAKEWQLDVTIKTYNKNLQAQGYSLAYYLYYGLGLDYDTFREELKKEIDSPAKEAVLKDAVCRAEGIEFNEETLEQYLEEFGYTSGELDEVADEADQEQAVIWYLTAKTIIDNGTVTYLDADEYAEKYNNASSDGTAD